MSTSAKALSKAIRAIRSAKTLNQLITAKKYFDLATVGFKNIQSAINWARFGSDEYHLKSQELEKL